MSIRTDIKGGIPHFLHDPEYVLERNRFRSIVRSLKTATDNLSGKKKTAKRKKNDSGTGTTES
jgi:hypothetical protein